MKCSYSSSFLGILITLAFVFGGSPYTFAQPANDSCLSATDVTADLNSGSCTSYVTSGATNSFTSSCDTNYCSGGSANNTNNNVWFSFTAPSSGALTLTINTYSWNTPNYDPIVAIYSSCDSTTEMYCSSVGDDGSDQDGSKTAVFAGLVSGNTYYLSVDPPCSVTGSFCLKLDYLAHCLNGVQDADEIGVDCGGVDCAECVPNGMTFQKAYGADVTSEFGRYAEQTSDGGYIAMGYTNSFGQGIHDFYLVKTDAMGDTSWTKTYGGSSNEFGWMAKQTADGGYVLVGSTQMGPGSQSIYIVRVNSVGDSLWSRAHGGTSTDDARSVIVTADGGFVIGGWTYNQGAGNSDAYLFKLNALGDTVWSRSYGGASYDEFRHIKQTTDGGYIAVGTTQSYGAGSVDVYLVKMDSVGDTLWTRAYGNTTQDYGESVIEVSTGGFLACGYSQLGPGTTAIYLIRTDVNGDTLWTRAYGGTAENVARSLVEHSSGDFIVVGYTTSFGLGGKDVYFLKISAGGQLLVAKTFGGTLDDDAYSIRPSSDGGFIICGDTRSYGGGDLKMNLIKTDENGVTWGCFQSGTSTDVEVPITNVESTTTVITTVDTGITHVTVPSNVGVTQTLVLDRGIGIALSGNDVTCFGGNDGQATADVSCAPSPFSFLWSDGQTTSTATGLAAGSYEVLVTDSAGNIDSNTIAIFQAALISPTIVAAYQICTGSDGNIYSWASGGTGPLSYQWSNGDTTNNILGLQAAMYNVTITDSIGCSVTDSAEVTLRIDTLDISFIASTLICDGVCDATMDANVTGGTFPYSYSWNDPDSTTTDLATGLCPGEYTVVITDAYGCMGTDSASVNVLPMPVQDICMVTVDSTSTRNLVVWEKPIMAGIDYYNVYREVSTNNYVQLGSVPYASLSEFTDTTNGVNPSTTAYRYKISVVDTCGVENTLSTAHKTIHLIISLDIFSRPVLQWNDYQGVTIANYHILRDSTGTNNWQVLDSVPFGVNSWTDLNAPSSPNLTYLVEMKLSSTCTSTKQKNYNSSKSNTLASGTTLTATVSSTDASSGVCNGTVSVAANYGLLPYTYTWNTAPVQTTSSVDSLCQGTYTVIVVDGNGNSDTATVTVDQPNSMTATISTVNPTFGNCDGALSVAAGAGVPPYTYLWNTIPPEYDDNTDSLCQGTYNVTVYDNAGDSVVLSATITEIIPPMVGSASSSDATQGNCDGTASSTVSGGMVPYTYIWNSTPIQTTANADSLCQGTYDVTVFDGNGDSIVLTVTIAETIPPLNGSTGTTAASPGNCDGTALLTPSGGTPPYTYSWNTVPTETTATIDSLCPGTYDVTVYDSNGDSMSFSVTVTGAAAPLSTTTSFTDANAGNCDGTATVTASGGIPPYTYLWDDSLAQTTATAVGLCGGVYNVTVYDASGASEVTSVTVGSTTPPIADFIASKILITVGESINFLDQSQYLPTSWVWLFMGASPPFSTDQHPTSITYDTEGCFEAQLAATNSDGTDTMLKTCYIEVGAVSISELERSGELKVYPNPSAGVFSIQMDHPNSSLYNLIVRDLIGREVYSSQVTLVKAKATSSVVVDLSHLPVGVYEMVVSSADQMFVQKLIIR